MISNNEGIIKLDGGNYQLLAELAQIIFEMKEAVSVEVTEDLLLDCFVADTKDEFFYKIDTDWDKLKDKIEEHKKRIKYRNDK